MVEKPIASRRAGWFFVAMSVLFATCFVVEWLSGRLGAGAGWMFLAGWLGGGSVEMGVRILRESRVNSNAA